MSTLIARDRFVVNQKAKIIEMVNEYAIRDTDGATIGAIRQEGQSTFKKVARFVSSLDQFMTHTLAVYDADGTKVMTVTRPRKFVKSKVIVSDGMGQDVRSIVQRNMVGKIRFGLEDTMGGDLGEIRAENWRAWNFMIVDTAGNEVGRITKTWEGLAKTMFTTADNFVVQIHRPLEEPLRSLVVASSLAIDTALKQDSRGFG